MGLGTNGFRVKKGDLVKVVAQESAEIPAGTIGLVRQVWLQGQSIQLEGFDIGYLQRSQVEVLSYCR